MCCEREILKCGVVNQGALAPELFFPQEGRQIIIIIFRQTSFPPNHDFQTCQYAVRLLFLHA